MQPSGSIGDGGVSALTNTIKTVKYPRLIWLRSGDTARLGSLLADILGYCSFSSCMDDLAGSTDYILYRQEELPGFSGRLSADTALLDGSEAGKSGTEKFRRLVISYEELPDGMEDDSRLITYSSENYSADVTCRNIVSQGDSTVFDIVSGGILSRARIDSSEYSVDEVLVCTAVLLAAGIPLASVLGYFNR